ncbi:hypothetical protein [Roseateles sp.]|uniref:hypothetical protein n=1 Tax=Roseateles sp. TaxID=1971397 RepID=UPI003D0CB756
MTMSSNTQAPHSSILEIAKTEHYAENALEAIVQIPLANSPPELLDRLARATMAIGASGSIYTACIPEGGLEASSFSLFACHPGFAQAQCTVGSMLEHPWFRFARSRTVAGTDHQVPRQDPNDAQAIELANQYGFKSCLIVPTPAGSDLDRLEMLCLGSATPDDFEGKQAQLVRTLARALAGELHDWLTRHLQDRLRASARLQTHDVTLLSMEWQGLGTKEIAKRTGLTATSVNSRFQRINARLHCRNRRASAQRAAAHGLLESS